MCIVVYFVFALFCVPEDVNLTLFHVIAKFVVSFFGSLRFFLQHFFFFSHGIYFLDATPLPGHGVPRSCCEASRRFQPTRLPVPDPSVRPFSDRGSTLDGRKKTTEFWDSLTRYLWIDFFFSCFFFVFVPRKHGIVDQESLFGFLKDRFFWAGTGCGAPQAKKLAGKKRAHLQRSTCHVITK